MCRVFGSIAEELAEARGVSDLCTFRLMDMVELDLPDATFDLVVNQETVCHAWDKERYFSGVHRVLKPGGSWRSIDFAVREGKLAPEEEELHRRVCELWHFPPLCTAPAIHGVLQGSSFVELDAEDLTLRTTRTALHILRFSRVAMALQSLGADRLITRDPTARQEIHRHFAAGIAYSQGLLQGTFRHMFYEGRKPQCS